MAADWEWDSYAEQAEITREVADEFRPLTEKKYLAGRIDEAELSEYVEEWAPERE